MGVAPSHLGLLRGGATLTSERQGPLSQGRTVLYATRPKPSAQLIRATRSRDATLYNVKQCFGFVVASAALEKALAQIVR